MSDVIQILKTSPKLYDINKNNLADEGYLDSLALD